MATKNDIPLLSAEWINDRVNAVIDQMQDLLDYLIDDGILASGYLPFETPITPEQIRRMTAEQIRKQLDTNPSITAQAEILKALEGIPATIVPEPTPKGY